jgi:regulator of sirC expression with transglutaminase-like and TPR domain
MSRTMRPFMCRDLRFHDYVQRDESQISPAVGALLFARHEYPGLDVDLYLGRLDAYGRSAARRLRDRRDPYQAVRALNGLCFEEERLEGDTQTYYDPRNSFLNEVMDRRRGIPITLSALYLDVGVRGGLPLRGVAFPGHFLVRYDHPEATLFIDPFNAGRILSGVDLRSMLSRYEGREAEVRDGHLRVAGSRAILARMLGHLKRLYAESGAHEKVMWVTGCRLALDPGSAPDARDRGLAALRLRRYPEALRDLVRSVALDPRSPDASSLQETIGELRRLVPLLN